MKPFVAAEIASAGQTEIVDFRTAKINSPVLYQIGSLEEGFNLLNSIFFENNLPHVMINQQRKKSDCYFSPGRWNAKDGSCRIDEINLTPSSMNRDDKEILSTLAHAMVHQWQHYYGKPPRPGYHNQQWAEKMLSIGLRPVSADNPDKMTGEKIRHEIIIGGPFDMLMDKSFFNIKYYSDMTNGIKNKSKNQYKIKYTCSCGNNLWGKSGLNVICNSCNTHFIEEKRKEKAKS